jgi:hypothetical protein
MKQLSYILLISFLVTPAIFSCNKFLSVTPKTQTPQDVLFSSEGGFKDALTGVYIQMKSNDSYGLNLTQTTIERLVSSWDVLSGSLEEKLGLFNFNDGTFVPIWKQQYTVIASINAILGQIDSHKEVFTTPGMYEMIKSECLALRAYCHLDILRLFGPVPTNTSAAVNLPYALVLSTTPQPHIPYDVFKANLLKDLADAEALIAGKDPIQSYSLYQLKNPGIGSGFNPADDFVAYRTLRMNYYAIKALQARTYLWFGEKEKAYQSAKLVIEAKNADGSIKFSLGTATDLSPATKNYVLTGEHLFGLYVFTLNDIYTNYYATGTLKKGTTESAIKTTLYGNTGTDIRESNLWDLLSPQPGEKAYVIKKYASDANAANDVKQIPLLRLSEMYLIAAEAAPYAEGVQYFRTFRTARNIGNLLVPGDGPALQTEIIKEYRKEFYAEGQAFYAYKRINAPRSAILFAPALAIVNYVIPVPPGETF